MVDYIADYYQGVEARPVRPSVEPGYLKVGNTCSVYSCVLHEFIARRVFDGPTSDGYSTVLGVSEGAVSWIDVYLFGSWWSLLQRQSSPTRLS